MNFVAILYLLLSQAPSSTNLYVFYPTHIRPQALETFLQNSFPNYKVTVFGRYKDFFNQVRQENPTAILTKPDLIHLLSPYRVQYRGQRKGSDLEHYCLLSIQSARPPPASHGLTLGVLAFLGRNDTVSYLSRFFQFPIKVKRVTRSEDLLPLLTFKMVDQIFIPEREVSYFRNISRLKLNISPIDVQIGIISFATKQPAPLESDLISLNSIPKKAMEILGIEGWLP